MYFSTRYLVFIWFGLSGDRKQPEGYRIREMSYKTSNYFVLKSSQK